MCKKLLLKPQLNASITITSVKSVELQSEQKQRIFQLTKGSKILVNEEAHVRVGPLIPSSHLGKCSA